MSFLTTFSLLLSLWKISWTWRTACILRKPREPTGKISPKELAANNPNVKHLRRGEALFHRKNVVAIAWKDKKQSILRAPKAIYLEMGQLTVKNGMEQ